ncbi:MAG: hypothetical protein QW810_00590 [Nitrososphaerota archaeon]
MEILKVNVSKIAPILLLICLTVGVNFVGVGTQRTSGLEETATVTETIYTYTGVPITETYTKTIREYVTVIQTSIEFSSIFKTQSVTVAKTISLTITETVTLTVYTYLPFETYSTMLAIMVTTVIILLIILIRLRKYERRQVEEQ